MTILTQSKSSRTQQWHNIIIHGLTATWVFWTCHPSHEANKIICAAIDRRVIQCTSSGKSICYYLPLLYNQLTALVLPLFWLIRSQNWQKKGYQLYYWEVQRRMMLPGRSYLSNTFDVIISYSFGWQFCCRSNHAEAWFNNFHSDRENINAQSIQKVHTVNTFYYWHIQCSWTLESSLYLHLTQSAYCVPMQEFCINFAQPPYYQFATHLR